MRGGKSKIMPKVFQINVTANWGSTGKIAEQIGSCAIQHGWDSYLAYGRMSNPSKNSLIKIGNQLYVYEHYIENKLFDNEGLASRYATVKLINKIKEISPDIIHLHNIHDHYLNYKLLFNFLNSISIPVVWTFHDCWAFTGSCYYFDVTHCDKWKSLCVKCPAPEGFYSQAKKHFLLKKKLYGAKTNLTIVPVSSWIEGLVRRSFLSNCHLETIKNGIDLSIFKPRQTDVRNRLSIKKETFVVLGVALPWSARKGLMDFIKLATCDNFQIVLVGVSKEQKKILPPNIIAIERTSSAQELAEYYSMADLFVNPTYSDNYPTTNLEALACGTPVITYNTGGSPEAIDENTGMVVEQGNIDALAKAIHQAINKPFLSDNCRKRAERYFDKDKCFEKYIKLYERLLG